MAALSRLGLAKAAGQLPEINGKVAIFGPFSPDRVNGLGDIEFICVSGSATQTLMAQAAGIATTRSVSGLVDHAIVFAPRSKAEGLAMIVEAARCAAHGSVIVDGLKTDGIDSLYKQLKTRAHVSERYSKAHGKSFWFKSSTLSHSEDWQWRTSRTPQGYVTAPGIFSADGLDPASELLIAHLPERMSGEVVDLGAGWGALSAAVLERADRAATVHLVEDSAVALECAEQNVNDPRARFYWADARHWLPTSEVNTVVMNPPFHVGRDQDIGLGLSFVDQAAQMLVPGGQLFMVANAHLPYEASLEKRFDQHECIARTSRFKVFKAQRNARARKR